MAPSLQKLLVEIDGREVEKGGKTVKLATASAPMRRVEMSPLRRFLAVIADPNIASILFTLGLLGLIFEVMNPGAVLPGVVGGICLILGFFALSVLPFNYAGLALIALAVIFFVAEIKVTSYGMLTVAGIVSLVLGLLLLFKTADPAMRVSRELVAALAVFAAVVVVSLMVLVLRARRSRVRTGSPGDDPRAGAGDLGAGPARPGLRPRRAVERRRRAAGAGRAGGRGDRRRRPAAHRPTAERAGAGGTAVVMRGVSRCL